MPTRHRCALIRSGRSARSPWAEGCAPSGQSCRVRAVQATGLGRGATTHRPATAFRAGHPVQPIPQLSTTRRLRPRPWCPAKGLRAGLACGHGLEGRVLVPDLNCTGTQFAMGRRGAKRRVHGCTGWPLMRSLRGLVPTTPDGASTRHTRHSQWRGMCRLRRLTHPSGRSCRRPDQCTEGWYLRSRPQDTVTRPPQHLRVGGHSCEIPGIPKGHAGSKRGALNPNRHGQGSDGKKLLAFGVAYLTL